MRARRRGCDSCFNPGLSLFLFAGAGGPESSFNSRASGAFRGALHLAGRYSSRFYFSCGRCCASPPFFKCVWDVIVSWSWSETFLVEKAGSLGRSPSQEQKKKQFVKSFCQRLVLVPCKIQFRVEMKEHLSKPHCPFMIFRTAWDDISLPRGLIYVPDFQENTASVRHSISICWISLQMIQ